MPEHHLHTEELHLNCLSCYNRKFVNTLSKYWTELDVSSSLVLDYFCLHVSMLTFVLQKSACWYVLDMHKYTYLYMYIHITVCNEKMNIQYEWAQTFCSS